MRINLALPLALSLLTLSLPSFSAQYNNPRLNLDYTASVVVKTYPSGEMKASDLHGSDINNLFSVVQEINNDQEKDKTTLNDLTRQVQKLQSENNDLKRSQDDLRSKLEDLSRKIK